MKNFQELDLPHVPLAGLILIEASAGTGKTWTIAGLYLRLILEKALEVERILVMTYTKSATAELRDRLRKRLRDAYDAVSSGRSDDAFLGHLVSNIKDPEWGKRQLARALSHFDEAAIYTIHGFCQRALNEYAFEAGSEFECDIIADETEVLQKIVEDFWRLEFAEAKGAWLQFLLDRPERAPECWRQQVESHLGKPYLEVIPEILVGADDLHEEADAEAKYQVARSAWCQERGVIAGLLDAAIKNKDLNGNSYRLAGLEGWIAEADSYFSMERCRLDVPACLRKLSSAALAKGANKGKQAPKHEFFERCRDLLESLANLTARFEDRWARMFSRLRRYCDEELSRHKAERKQLSYNDLLNEFNEALKGKQGKALALALRERYPAALIDEFQDTDPVQYEIFRAIYMESGKSVFFVGDPKQAIYGFRGADLFSYLRARDETDSRFTLRVNQRSQTLLVSAVNALFERSVAPFVLNGLEFPPVVASSRMRPVLVAEGDNLPPFRFHMLPSASEGKKPEGALTKTSATSWATHITVDEIVHLLDESAHGRLLLAEGDERRELYGGDIAVLVSTHRQGQEVQRALTSRGVPCVRQGQDNIYQTQEAEDFERWLMAVVYPRRDGLIKAALATELMGMEGSALYDLVQDDVEWERTRALFDSYHGLWTRRGFMPMFRHWMDDYAIAARLLTYVDGERRLTNLLHLGELVQAASRESASVEHQLRAYSQRRHNDSECSDDDLLRLESDAQRVQIVTIHSSKGLEYPIVFCPFLWDGQLRSAKDGAAAFHDSSRNHRPVVDFGSADWEMSIRALEQERLAEKLRLLYVALTRAVHQCHVVWGHVKEMETAPLTWLLHGPAVPVTDPVAHLRSLSLSQEIVMHQVTSLQKEHSEAVAVKTAHFRQAGLAARATERVALNCRDSVRTPIQPTWRMTSFTRLTAGRHSEVPDYDAVEQVASLTSNAPSIFNFPRGATSGRCLHGIFEKYDFNQGERANLEKLVLRELLAFGLPENWMPVIAATVEATLDTPLDGEGLRLRDIPSDQRLPEMEFTFSIRNAHLSDIHRLLGSPQMGLDPRFVNATRRLSFETTQGYLKGFVDLVFHSEGRFYLVDYKSNWLGERPSDYVPEALTEVMAREHYYLQLLIYSVALHRYLRQRVEGYRYESHFGGGYYLFLRGMGHNCEEPAAGVFRMRPNPALIDALDQAFG